MSDTLSQGEQYSLDQISFVLDIIKLPPPGSMMLVKLRYWGGGKDSREMKCDG